MNRVLISVAIPVVALLAWVVKLERGLQSGFHVRVRIQGYDPRDLLTGHFVRYSLNFNSFQPCPADQPRGDTCVCLMKEDNTVYFTPDVGSDCAAAPQNCGLFLKGQCEGSRFTAGVERFSIPERLAPVLQSVPENSSAILAVRPDGSAAVVDLMVGEENISQYAEERLLNPDPTPAP